MHLDDDDDDSEHVVAMGQAAATKLDPPAAGGAPIAHGDGVAAPGNVDAAAKSKGDHPILDTDRAGQGEKAAAASKKKGRGTGAAVAVPAAEDRSRDDDSTVKLKLLMKKVLFFFSFTISHSICSTRVAVLPFFSMKELDHRILSTLPSCGIDKRKSHSKPSSASTYKKM